MHSVERLGPFTLGILTNLVIALLICSPLLFIFVRAYHQPSSMLWKTVYAPRTWWPPNPAKRAHRIFDPLPTYSTWRTIFLLLTGRSLRLIHPNQSSTDTDRFQDPQVFTDEEIHLRFLALCLRLTFLGLVLSLPISLVLFIFEVPLIPPQISSSPLESFTVLRLIYHYDISPKVYSTKLIAWAVSSLFIGSIVTFMLILAEWSFLKSHLQRFLREKCDDLQIVFLPSLAGGGLDQIGEKDMVSWVRSCALGPIGFEGDGEALKAFKRANSAQISYDHSRRKAKSKHSQIFGAYSNLNAVTDSELPTIQNRLASSSIDFPSSQSRALIVHGVFTISDLDHLTSLSNRRREVLDELEMAEAQYVAGFTPKQEEIGGQESPTVAKHRRRNSKKTRDLSKNSDIKEGEVTPYGPSALYKLDTKPPEMLKMDWESPTIRISYAGFEPDWNHKSDDKANDEPRHDDIPQAASGPMFSEVVQDLDLSTSGYRSKWAVGNQVEVNTDGTLLSLPPPDQNLQESSLPVGTPSRTNTQFTTPDVRLPHSNCLYPQSLSSRTQIGLNASSSRFGQPSTTSLMLSEETHISSSLLTDFSTQECETVKIPKSYTPASTTLAELLRSDNGDPLGTHPMYIKENPRSGSFSARSSHRSSVSSIDEISQKASSARPLWNRLSDASAGPSLVHALFEVPGFLDPSRRTPIPVQLSSAARTFPSPALRSAATAQTTMSGSIVGSETSSRRHLQPHRFEKAEDIKDLYRSIRTHRSELKRLNGEFSAAREKAIRDMADGTDGAIRGWVFVGKGVRMIPGVHEIMGMTREDVNWDCLGKTSLKAGLGLFWSCFLVLVALEGVFMVPISMLTTSVSPELKRYPSSLQSIHNMGGYILGLVSVTIPCVLNGILLLGGLFVVFYLAQHCSGIPSKSASQLLAIKAGFTLILGCFIAWFTCVGATANSIYQIRHGVGVANQLANSLSNVSSFFFSLECLLALIVPAFVLAQPKRWKSIIDALRKKQTPRQRVLSFWPDDINPIVSRCSAMWVASVVVIFFPIAPLIVVPAAFFSVTMILAQHRNIRFLYRRSSQTGGRIELMMVSMLGLALGLQSGLVGFLLLSREQWALATVSYAICVSILITTWTVMIRGQGDIGKDTLDFDSQLALEVFQKGPQQVDHRSSSTQSSSRDSATESIGHPLRPSSMDSTLDLLSTTIETSHVRVHRAVPLLSESVDHLVDTRLALRTYPDAPPHLPDLPWNETDKFSQEIMYPPILFQSSPAVWLPKDGVAEEEVKDLGKYWGLEAYYEEGISVNELNLQS